MAGCWAEAGRLQAARCAPVWPRQLRRWSTPPSSEGQSSGQEVHQRADPGPRPGCQAEAGQLQAARCAPVCGPGRLRCWSAPPAPRGQGDGQKARQRADLSHWPDVGQRPDSSRRYDFASDSSTSGGGAAARAYAGQKSLLSWTHAIKAVAGQDRFF